jgi:hypothetical protein
MDNEVIRNIERPFHRPNRLPQWLVGLLAIAITGIRPDLTWLVLTKPYVRLGDASDWDPLQMAGTAVIIVGLIIVVGFSNHGLNEMGLMLVFMFLVAKLVMLSYELQMRNFAIVILAPIVIVVGMLFVWAYPWQRTVNR